MSYENDLHIRMLNDYWKKIQELKQQLQQKEEQLKVACELMKTQKDCIDHLLGKKESFGDATTSGFGLRVDVFLQKQESLKTTKESHEPEQKRP